MAQKDIKSILIENRIFPPGKDFRRQARISSRADYDALRNNQGQTTVYPNLAPKTVVCP